MIAAAAAIMLFLVFIPICGVVLTLMLFLSREVQILV
ncbi:hypothetical protein B14911_24800 [Bacillus sp. NRRL B-14911]|nr:hypothetical protein B14911_24800 [Bacillus sp. NRRL B-14911]